MSICKTNKILDEMINQEIEQGDIDTMTEEFYQGLYELEMNKNITWQNPKNNYTCIEG